MRENKNQDSAVRIGLYLCECGPNIKDGLDTGEVLSFARGLNRVVMAEPFGVLCSQEGQARMARDIRDLGLTRVVVAGCSPKEHEETFREVLSTAGLNPYLLQIANIREQCVWITPDRERATKKAKILIEAAVNRVVFHEPLVRGEMDAVSDLVVIGAGAAGVSAALTAAQGGRKVFLVEKAPFIGGKTALYGELYPGMECASCVLEPLLDEVLHHDRIEVMTLSEVEEVLGSFGNFIVKVRSRARRVDSGLCLGCGACTQACPVRGDNPYNMNLDERAAVSIPFAGALPNLAFIDQTLCVRARGEDCTRCRDACAFGAIRYEDEDVIREVRAGAVVVATGFDLYDPAQDGRYGYGVVENVRTSMEFERILSATGPTGGEIVLENGLPPERVALVHCVGPRSREARGRCSATCCKSALKYAHLIKSKRPDTSVVLLHSGLCLPGRAAAGLQGELEKMEGVAFVPVASPGAVSISKSAQAIRVDFRDGAGREQSLETDLAVLLCASRGAEGADQTAALLDLALDPEGFFLGEHDKVAPLATAVRGVFIAGGARSPGNVEEAVAQGQAAAGQALAALLPGQRLYLDATAAAVDEAVCSGCKVCLDSCPYKALAYDDETGRVTVREALCRGCGTCAATCPSGAMTSRHFSCAQIYGELEGILHGEP